ncbi:MAG: prepilin-type N-terminal cleavage/methylation domain-containing protein [Armatimonadota bacterium]|nr:prepilin-type N-terminal cleavage/methylation domain-containing protein [Armatimonadota bacterium]MDR7425560.1 prepilin-type N-terminal cleavage/methylation domain-containing protein [Armatimonadota bacterium]
MRQQGHTLVEVLVSVLLLALALVPLLELYPSLVAANQSDRDLSILSAVASGRLEELRAGLFEGSVGLGTGSEPCPPPYEVGDYFPLNCLLQWDVTSFQTDPVGGWLRNAWVVACVDGNSSGTCDSGELQVRYETRVTSRPQ